MNKSQLLINYKSKKEEIKKRLQEFSKIPKKDYLHELFFCILTPQSQAKKCWQAVVQIKKNNLQNKKLLQSCLASKTRFHKNKTEYLIEARKKFPKIKNKIAGNFSPLKLRNWLAENVKGLGLKESSHFLRNIGKSENQIAILDRHILKNLEELKIIKKVKNLNKKSYLEIEKKFKNFSEKIKIPLDYLDLLFWSEETGTIFK